MKSNDGRRGWISPTGALSCLRAATTRHSCSRPISATSPRTGCRSPLLKAHFTRDEAKGAIETEYSAENRMHTAQMRCGLSLLDGLGRLSRFREHTVDRAIPVTDVRTLRLCHNSRFVRLSHSCK